MTTVHKCIFCMDPRIMQIQRQRRKTKMPIPLSAGLHDCHAKLNTDDAQASKSPPLKTSKANLKIQTMKILLPLLCSTLLLTQCSAPRSSTPTETVRTPQFTPGGLVTVQTLGDSTVATRRLIQHPLTNKDIGKVYEEVTLVSPSGTTVEERVIVRTAPKLETKLVSR